VTRVKFRLCVLLLMLLTWQLTPGSAQAQTYTGCVEDENILGIFFDNGDINTTATLGVQFNVYFAIINPTATSVDGFEFKLLRPDNPSFFTLSETFAANQINVGASPDYVVGFSTSVPVIGNQAIIMTHTVLALVPDPLEYFIALTAIPSISGNLAYVDANSGDLIEMYPLSGDFSLPMAQINGQDLDYCAQTEPLDMTVNLNFDGDNNNIAGTSVGATDGFDVDYDLLDNNNSLTFPHPEWNNPAGNFYRQDIKASYDPTREVKQWTFTTTAQAAQSGGRNASLTISPSFSPNPDIDFLLYDRTTNQTHDLFLNSTFEYFVSSSGFNRTFDLIVGRDLVINGELWVDVRASAASYSEGNNRLSTLAGATDGHDPGLEIPEPTPPPANYASSSFIHDDWPLGPRFNTDVRAIFDPTSEAKTWPLRVETDQSGTVALNFAASFTANDNITLKLKDLQSGQTFDLFPQLNYTFQSDGLSSYEFEIIVGAGGPPALSPTNRVLTSGWSLIGLPLDPAGQTLDQVIWDQTPGYAYLFSHEPPNGYGMRSPADPAVQGKGYWIATDTGFTWTMIGARNLAGQLIDMQEGWNLIGNPLWFPGPFEGISVVRGGTTYSWLEAIFLGYVATGVQSYDPNTGSYFDAVDLRPWEGYWVNALEPNLQLAFNWENFQVLPSRMIQNKSEIPIDARTWSIDLVLWDSKRNQTSVTLGINPDATEGFDPQYDMALPPSPPGGGPILAFTRPEWDLASGAHFSRDVMPQGDHDLTWNAIVKVTKPGTAKLIWDSSKWPDNADFQIYLPSENRVLVMSMRAESSVDLDLGTAALPIVIRTPNFASGVDDTPGLAYRVGVHPNPFNPMTTVSFDLPKSGKAEIRLYSVRGELVSILGGEHFAAGSHQVIWQGKDQSGRNAPSGSYFAKLYVDGKAQGSTTKMSLVR
jgi:hypothetical protein